MNALTIRFTLFGVPTTIHPMTWLILALLGGAFRIQNAMDLSHVLLFVVAGLIAILCHEYGHALTSRRLAGAYPEVVISGFSGYAAHEGARFTRWSYFATVLAGPLAGLIPGIIAMIALGIQTQNLLGSAEYALLSSFISILPLELSDDTMLRMRSFVSTTLQGEEAVSIPLFIFYSNLFFVSIIWTIFNLIPLYPLDGSKLLGSILNSDYTAALIGVIISIPLCFWALQTGSIFTILIVGYIAYVNFQFYQLMRSMRS